MANANELPFNDGEFDYVYSWGVLHHSPALQKSISELMRVTRAGGGVGVMLYNRRSLAHWYVTEFIEGFLNFENQFLGPLELASRYGDGYREEGNPHTWPVTQSEMEAMLAPHMLDLSFRIFGTELDGVLPMLWPGLGMFVPRFVKKTWARRFGWSLWMHGHKR
jgi:SAM-dependent methyltransferase